MRILRVIRSLNPAGGGPVEGLIQSAPFLHKLGLETSVVTLDHPSAPWIQSLPFQTFCLGPVLGSYGFSFSLPSKLKSIFPTFGAVIVEGLWQYHSFATWIAMRASSTPYYVFPHGMLDPWFKQRYPIKHLKKSLYWPLAEYKLLRDATSVFFTTQDELIRSQSSFSPYPIKGTVIGFGAQKLESPSSMDINEFYARFPELRGKKTILFFGRLHPKKGVDLLIHAFAKIASYDTKLHLVLAGPICSTYHYSLISLISSLSITHRVTWTGYLSSGLKRAAFGTAGLFSLPSHHENFGVSVAEALSTGLPVTVSRSVNIAPDITHFEAGIVHDDTVIGTYRALSQWLYLDVSARAHMSSQASLLFSTRYDWIHASSRLADLIFASQTSSS